MGLCKLPPEFEKAELLAALCAVVAHGKGVSLRDVLQAQVRELVCVCARAHMSIAFILLMSEGIFEHEQAGELKAAIGKRLP